MRALILVDLQRDFVPGGALAVPEGDRVVEVAKRLQPRYAHVVASQDWHPAGHESFASSHPGKSVGDVIQLHGIEQVLWPDHCVQGSAGAELLDALDTRRIDRVFRKGTDAAIDSYSAFFDNDHRKATGLGEHLAQQGVEAVDVLGLATDYCVKFTALDARELGFATRLVVDGCRGVELAPGDVDRAIDEMRAAGVEIVTSEEIR